MTEIFTIISCFYFFGTGTAVPNHCSPDFYDSAFQSMEACEKKRKERFVYDDKRIPPTKDSMDGRCGRLEHLRTQGGIRASFAAG
jgi:hypothetical protein